MGVTTSRPDEGAALYLRDQSRCKHQILEWRVCDDAKIISVPSLDSLTDCDELEAARSRPYRAKCLPSNKGQREP